MQGHPWHQPEMHPGEPGESRFEHTVAASHSVTTERPKGRKRGPKPMVDRDTMRFEAQLYPEQYTQASATIARLKLENREVPRSERRRFTVNTLIRSSMTVLLEHADELHGRTEDEILSSLRECIARRR